MAQSTQKSTKTFFYVIGVTLIALIAYNIYTAPTIYVDADGYIFQVNGKVLETPTKNPELFREAGRTIFVK